jgi:hypothetical protein
MRSDEWTSSSRVHCVGNSIARDDEVTISRSMDSPPPDAIWTVDKVLQKPPMAPVRQRPSRGGININSHESQSDYLFTYFDARNQEDSIDCPTEDTCKEHLHNENSFHRMLHNFDNDNDDDDEEMVHLHRIIRPSRKLFVEDKIDEDLMMVELVENENFWNTSCKNDATVTRQLESSQASQFPLLLLPILHNFESSQNKTPTGQDLNNTDGNTLNSILGNNQIPLQQLFYPDLVKDDFITSAVSSSTTDDNVSIGNNSFCHLDYESNVNISLSPGRSIGNQIFRRLEDNDKLNSFDRTHSLQFFRPLPSLLLEQCSSRDAFADNQDADVL